MIDVNGSIRTIYKVFDSDTLIKGMIKPTLYGKIIYLFFPKHVLCDIMYNELSYELY